MQHGLHKEEVAIEFSHCSNAMSISSSVVCFTLLRRSLMSENSVLFEVVVAVSDFILQN